MAIYNEILSARFPKLAQKLFSMKGEQAVKQLTGELTLVQNLPFGIEHRWLMSEDRYGAPLATTGAAGQFVAFRFRNPGGSNVIVAVEKLTVLSTTAQSVNIDISVVNALGDFGSPIVSQRIDGRTGTRASSTNNTFTNTKTIAIAASVFSVKVLANTPYDVILNENQELTVVPGDAISIGNSTAATDLFLGMYWRERPMEESELK